MNKLWFRLSGLFLALVLVVLLGVGLFLAQVIKTSYIDILQRQLYENAAMLRESVSTAHFYGQESGLQAKVDRYSEYIQARITLIDRDGTVLSDSEKNAERMDNHADRPEFQQAVEGTDATGESMRYSNTLNADMIYSAVPVVDESEIVGVVRVAVTAEKVQQTIWNLWLSLAAALGVALLFLTLVSIRMNKVITRPIERVVEVARELTKKNYHQRVHVQAQGEVKQLADSINHLASSLQQQMDENRENQQRLSDVISNIVSGVMLVSDSGRITLANSAVQDIFGHSPETLTGKRHTEMSHYFGLAPLIDRCLRSGTKIHEEMDIYYPRERILDVHITPYVNKQDGSVKGVIAVFHDITEIRRLEKVRSEFVANVSHELKTPITSVKGFAETLLDGAMSDPEACRSFLKIIYDESDRLHRLIEDILNLSKIEQNRIPLKTEPLNLVDLVTETAETLQEEVGRKRLQFMLPNPKQTIEFEGEKDRIRQIILNLMSNAVAYTPEEGRISVTAEDGGDQVGIKVSDTGIGIPQKDVHRIFERFYRVDKTRSRDSGGTGLGLAIVKHLVESHEGTIDVRSQEGVGTTFIVTLPKIQAND